MAPGEGGRCQWQVHTCAYSSICVSSRRARPPLTQMELRTWAKAACACLRGSTRLSSWHLHLCVKFYLHKHKALVLMHEAPHAQAEDAHAHVQSSIHANGASWVNEAYLRSRAKLTCAIGEHSWAKLHLCIWSFAHECKYPWIVQVDLHGRVLAHLSHSLVSNRLQHSSGLWPRGWGPSFKASCST